jgi:hypothetical protein
METIYNNDDIKYYYKVGSYYGYPKCCIDEFIFTRIKMKIQVPEKLIKISNGSGFIPCLRCYIKIKNKNAQLKSLIKNRKCKLNFPHDE